MGFPMLSSSCASGFQGPWFVFHEVRRIGRTDYRLVTDQAFDFRSGSSYGGTVGFWMLRCSEAGRSLSLSRS